MAAQGDEVSAATLPLRREGSGAPLVPVHGFPGGSAQRAADMAYPGRHFDVIAPDLAG